MIQKNKSVPFIVAFLSVLPCLLIAMYPPCVSAADNEQAFRFRLTKGVGTPVCDAYLKRLNTTVYKTPPYCDRPESTSVPGFSRLNRVRLSAEEILALFSRVSSFMSTQNERNQEEINEWRKSHGLEVVVSTLESVRDNMANGLIVWKYDPRTDVDNDGVPDNLIVWQGAGASNVIGPRCGEYHPKFGGGAPIRQNQIAYLVTEDNDYLDVPKTIATFGHPSGGYRLPNGKIARKFRPIGNSISIFNYDGLYYFDTFFDSSGDFEDKRKDSDRLVDTLGVFLNQDGKTRQVCEYQMVDPTTTNKGEKK